MRKKAITLLFCLTAAFLCPGQVLAANHSLYEICKDAASRAKSDGDLPKAERLYKQVLEMSESGSDPVAANNIDGSRYDLAVLYEAEQKYSLAVQLYQKLLDGKSRFYKPDFLKIRIAQCYLQSGKDADAYKLLASVKPGEDASTQSEVHQSVLGAIAAFKTGHKAECTGKLSSAVAAAIYGGLALEAGRKQKPDAANFAAVAKWLADNRCEDDAKLLYQTLLSDLVKVRGWSNPQTIDTAISLALLEHNWSATAPGLALIDKAIQSQTGASADVNKLKLLEAKRDFSLPQPQKLLVEKQALELSLTTGAPFSVVQRHLFYVTSFLSSVNKNQESKALTLRVLEHCEKTYGKNSHETAQMLMRAGSELANERDFNSALAYNSRAIAILEGLHKPESVHIVAQVLCKQAAYEEALKHNDKADAAYKRIIAMLDNSQNEIFSLEYLKSYQDFLKRVGRTPEAIAINFKMMAIFNRHSGGRPVVFMEEAGTTEKW
jgi:tetratricopeptide (TPR) repeat protein